MIDCKKLGRETRLSRGLALIHQINAPRSKCRRAPCGSGVVLIATVILLTGIADTVRAQFPNAPGPAGNIEGIAVTGEATLKAKPNLLEIDLQVAAAAEVTADAIVKYRDSKRRISEAFAALKLDNVSVHEQGLIVDNKNDVNPYYRYQASTSKPEIQLSRTLVVRVSNIRPMQEDELVELIGKLLDVAKDAGAQIGPVIDPYYAYYYGYRRPTSGIARFVLDDFQEIQDQAYQKAVDDARKRAERLATLSGVKLGPVLAIRETAVPDKPNRPGPSPYSYSGDTQEGSEDSVGRIESSKFEEVAVRVELLVRFAIAPKQAESSASGE